jgi:transcription elongation factor GreA
MPDKYLTKEGHEKLQNELKNYKKKRHEIAERIEEAKALGDLSENADYIKAKEEQSFNEGKIKKIENILNISEIVENNHNGKKIGLGSLITIKMEKGADKQYRIVGSGESDPTEGKISYEAPIGRLFFGKKKGDIINIDTPGGKKKYVIINVVND